MKYLVLISILLFSSRAFAQQPGFIGVDTLFCLNDAPVAVMLQPPGGTLTGPGVFNETNFSPLQAGAGLHTLIYVYNDNGAPQTVIQQVKVITTTPTPVITSNSPVCAGQTACLTVTNPMEGTSYSWTGPGGFASMQQNPCFDNASTGMSGVYTVKAQFHTCAASSIFINLVVNAIPATPNLSSNSPICEGQTLNFTASFISGATYTLTGPNGFISDMQNSTIMNASTLSAGIYTVVATVNGCTSPPATTTVTITPMPSPPFVSANTPVCEGGALHFTAPTIAGATYSWVGPNGFSATTQNPTITNFISLHAGTYTLIVTVNGCVSAPATITIPPPAQTTVTIVSPPDVVCLNGTAYNLQLEPNYTNFGAEGDGVFPAFIGYMFDPSVAGVGTHSITVTGFENGCTYTATKTVTVVPSPQILIEAIVNATCGNCPDGAIFAFVTGGTPPYTYVYTLNGNVVGSTQDYSGGMPGTYTLTVTDANGCTSSVEATIDGPQMQCVAPTGLTTQYLAPGAVLVSWGPVPGAASYALQYRKAGGNWLTLNVATNHYQLSGLSTEATYEAQVRTKCFNAAPSPYSETVTFTAFGGQAPCQRPNPVSATAVDMNHLLVKWPPASGALSYELQYRRSVGGAWSDLFSTASVNYTIGNLAPGTLYTVRVRSVCAGDLTTLWATAVTAATASGKDGSFVESAISETFISLYPNPNTGIFTLNVENFAFDENETGVPIEIFDLSGKKILSQQIVRQETMFDLSDYAKGLYFVKVLDKTAKVIVE